MNYRLLIERFCLNCKKGDLFAIGNCANESCELHAGRPNRSLQGHEPEAYDEDVLADQIETRLNVNGLKRLLNEQCKKKYGIR